MAYDGNALVRTLAKDAYDLLFLLDSRIAFDEMLYSSTGLDDEIYAAVQTNPSATSYADLTVGEIYNAVVAIRALRGLLSAASEQHRQALAKVVKARLS